MEIELSGIKGDILLGYFAGLGVINALSKVYPEVALRWNESGSAVLSLNPNRKREQLAKDLELQLQESGKAFASIGTGGFHKTTKEDFRSSLTEKNVSIQQAQILRFLSGETQHQIDQSKERLTLSKLVLLQGTGGKDYLKTVANLDSQMTLQQLEETLFQPWQYAEQSRNVSLLFSSFDRQEAALLAEKPSGINPAQLAANRLAVDGLLLVPTFLSKKDNLWTKGMSGKNFKWSLNPTFLDLEELNVLITLDSNSPYLLKWPSYETKRVTAGYYHFFEPAAQSRFS